MRLKANWVVGSIVTVLALLVILVLWVGSREDGIESDDWLDEVRSRSVDVSEADRPGSPHRLPGVDADPANAPAIAVEEQGVDAGVISRENLTELELVIFNVGNRALEITDVLTDEGCMVRAIEQSTIPAEDETVMTVVLDPSFLEGFEGEYELTILSNDPRQSRLPVRIEAKVDPEFTIEPRHFHFGEVARGETVEQTLRVQQASDVPVAITGVEPMGEASGLTVDCEKAPESEWENAARPEYLINASFSPRNEAGPYRAFLNLNPSLDRLPWFRVDVTADVVSFYEVEPSRITISHPVQPGQERIASVEISADRAVDIKDLTVTGDDFTVVLRSTEVPYRAYIDVNVAPDAQTGRRMARIEFTVDSGEETVSDSIQLIVRIAE